LTDSFSIDESADGGRGQPLLPWPNRIVDGRYVFDGQTLQLPIEEVERNNAMHGLTRWQNWSILEHTSNQVRLGLTIHPRPGYPFTLGLEIAYSLGESGLIVQTVAHNRGGGRCRLEQASIHISRWAHHWSTTPPCTFQPTVGSKWTAIGSCRPADSFRPPAQTSISARRG
jgi:hypothetical protein